MAVSQANQGCGWLFAILLGFIMLGQCSNDNDQPFEENGSRQVDPSSASPMQALEPPSGNTATFEDGQSVYVTADTLNARAQPNTSAAIASKLPRGSSVSIIERSGSWMRVRTSNGPAWISGDYVSRSRPAPRRTYRPPPRRSYGSCPCSGYNVCIGPRGGRYCITSGGNKRYGV